MTEGSLKRRFNVEQPSLFNELCDILDYGSLAEVPSYLERGADPDTRDKSGNTILMLAASQGDEALARLALRKGASLTAENAAGQTAMDLAIDNTQPGIARLLLQSGLPLDMDDYDYALNVRRMELAPPFIEAGADINRLDKYGNSPLMLATITGSEATATWLVDHGADLDIANRGHSTALNLAIYNRRDSIITLLLDRGASPYNAFYGKLAHVPVGASFDGIRDIIAKAGVAYKQRKKDEALERQREGIARLHERAQQVRRLTPRP